MEENHEMLKEIASNLREANRLKKIELKQTQLRLDMLLNLMKVKKKDLINEWFEISREIVREV